VKSIKAKIILIVLAINILGGAVIIAGMNMAYVRNVELVKQASSESMEQDTVQEQLFADMAGNRNRAIMMVALLTVVMSTSLLLALNSLLFKRIKKVINDAMGMIGGRHDTPIVVVRKDEMGEIEQALEQYRVLFVDAVSQAKDS